MDVSRAQVDDAEIFRAGDWRQAAPVLFVIRVQGAEHVVQGAEVRTGLGADGALGRRGMSRDERGGAGGLFDELQRSGCGLDLLLDLVAQGDANAAERGCGQAERGDQVSKVGEVADERVRHLANGVSAVVVLEGMWSGGPLAPERHRNLR